MPWNPLPGGGALDDLTDVVITTPNDGDVLTYDSGSGDWIDAAPGGGSGHDHGLEFTTPLHADGDNFDDGSLHADWTEDLDTSVTAVEQNGAWRVSINVPAGAGVTRSGYITRTIAGLGTGDTAIVCCEFAVLFSELAQVEFALESGADQVLVRVGVNATGGTTLEAYRNVSGFTQFYTGAFEGMGNRIWLALKYEAANTFGFHFSLDGELWAPVITGQTATLTPTTARLGAVTFDAGGPMQAAYHFFDVVDTI